jgi:hypothetical protein
LDCADRKPGCDLGEEFLFFIKGGLRPSGKYGTVADSRAAAVRFLK